MSMTGCVDFRNVIIIMGWVGLQGRIQLLANGGGGGGYEWGLGGRLS